MQRYKTGVGMYAKAPIKPAAPKSLGVPKTDLPQVPRHKKTGMAPVP
jgi:hypothetical protein